MTAGHLPAAGRQVEWEDTAEADGQTGEVVRLLTSRRRPGRAVVRGIVNQGLTTCDAASMRSAN
jgi:hypothetical protein